ncbi:DUF305 domain-containing protein [Nocardioides mesophilus]|uniref:DUF305 domain-containing protein n=1 Tax=Nocardioides mesophilus TaxID=433659 RepID=A0A7G9RCW8_9ACTN|nr:DUF305 domain-containing protein [Nocardioides mesophilus]QNN53443.1 DUF305 domain-containing protein [Nocardioides mesophilus]
MKKTLALTAALLAATLTLSACGNSDTGDTSNGSDQFNDADVSFATDMIPHHQQAVQMTEMAADRASSPEVKQLADEIAAAQGPEIDTMTGWLEAWGQELPADSMDHGDMGHGDEAGGMPGMMDADTMDELEQASGEEFDEMFLTSMIEHHEGAIEMARTEQAHGENPDALALAEKIEKDQRAEITQMKAMLGS